MSTVEISVRFFGSQKLFVKQMIRCRNIVVSIRLDTLHCVVGVKAVVIQETTVDFIVDRHEFFAWKKPFRPFISWLSEPRVVSNLFNRVPFVRIGHQNFWNEMGAICREEGRRFVFARHNFLVQIWCFGVFKGQKTTDHGIEDYTAWPHVRFQSVVLFTSNYFWRSIARRSASCLQKLIWRVIHIWKTKVDNFKSFVKIEK